MDGGRYYKYESLSVEANKSVDRMMDILSQNLSDKEKARMLPIVEFLKTNDIIDTQTIRQITEKSKTTVFRYVQRLVELEVLEKDGSSVSTLYRRR